MTTAVELQGASRFFGEVRAVDQVDLTITEGEFFALLGPSGSGKTTVLRLIAGFERASQGSIQLFGTTVNDVPPYRRPVNTVFQDYALFPHLNVIDNVAYSLKVRGVSRAERNREATAALELVRLPHHSQRKPSELSGGQRQRVALARALVSKPRVLLLDEPLGALDLKLREEMQVELKALQRKLGITFVFVTHDQHEALSLADRIAIFNEGKIVQAGLPEIIYRKPSTRFVADFVGSSNVLPPDVVERISGEARWASLRPEDVLIYTADEVANARSRSMYGPLPAVVQDRSYLGGQTKLVLQLDEQTISSLQPSRAHLPELTEQVFLGWRKDDLHLMDG